MKTNKSSPVKTERPRRGAPPAEPGRAQPEPGFGGDEHASSSPVRSLRADARRNRTQVLEAAREAFAAEGLSVSLDEIARRAGVGAGTVYRHFPSKEVLFEAVILSRLEQLVEESRALCADSDAGTAFFGFVSRLIDEGAVKKDLVDALAGTGFDTTVSLAAATQDLQDAINDLLTRAQRAGAVRSDVGVSEVMAIVGALLTTLRYGDAPVHSRVLRVIYDGLRGAGA